MVKGKLHDRPVPLDRNLLIVETMRFYGSILSGLRYAYSARAKTIFPDLFFIRDELSIELEGLLLFRDRAVVFYVVHRPMHHHLNQGPEPLVLTKCSLWSVYCVLLARVEQRR